jgi:molecular chaperone GrpE
VTDTASTSEQERLPLDEPLAKGGTDGGAQDTDRGSQETAAPGGAADAQAAPYETPDEQAARIRELTADLQRLQAEYVNYKRRVDRDRELVLQNAKFSILSALLPVLDDVDRAREHEELNGGFKAVAESLERIVAGQGLVRFGAPGDPFDPRIHEALMHSLSPEATMTTCDKVVQAGYQFGDRVVRPALVTVVDPDPSAGTVTGTAADTGAETGAETGAAAEPAPGAAAGAARGDETSS